ncbi:MAG: SatD family protein [Bacteroidota bacterium]
MDLNTNYYLLLIDIINSTQLSDQDFNGKMDLLGTSLIDINNQLENDLVIPLSVNYGDEIAGLFFSPENIFMVVMEIRKVLFPLTTIRFVVVKGFISRISSDIRQIGGIIFKKANQEIDLLKKNNYFCSWQCGNSLTDKTLESLCEISNVLLQDMSEYQRNVYELLRHECTQKQIAEKLGKYTQSVWDAIHRSKANYIIEAEKTLQLILKEYK